MKGATVPEARADDCLIAWCPCGGLVFATNPDLSDTADEVARMIRLGYHLGRMRAGEVRASRWCANGACGKRPAAPSAEAPDE